MVVLTADVFQLFIKTLLDVTADVSLQVCHSSRFAFAVFFSIDHAVNLRDLVRSLVLKLCQKIRLYGNL